MFYIVNGRIPHDQEDTTKIIRANNVDKAIEKFKKEMLEEGEATEYEEEDGKNVPVVYINYAIRCKNKPVFEYQNY